METESDRQLRLRTSAARLAPSGPRAPAAPSPVPSPAPAPAHGVPAGREEPACLPALCGFALCATLLMLAAYAGLLMFLAAPSNAVIVVNDANVPPAAPRSVAEELADISKSAIGSAQATRNSLRRAFAACAEALRNAPQFAASWAGETLRNAATNMQGHVLAAAATLHATMLQVAVALELVWDHVLLTMFIPPLGALLYIRASGAGVSINGVTHVAYCIAVAAFMRSLIEKACRVPTPRLRAHDNIRALMIALMMAMCFYPLFPSAAIASRAVAALACGYATVLLLVVEVLLRAYGLAFLWRHRAMVLCAVAAAFFLWSASDGDFVQLDWVPANNEEV